MEFKIALKIFADVGWHQVRQQNKWNATKKALIKCEISKLLSTELIQVNHCTFTISTFISSIRVFHDFYGPKPGNSQL